MNWKPSNQPIRYDRARVTQLSPVRTAFERLGLPLMRLRKLNGIFNALTMQIEDGGDHPEVNRLLLDALRIGILHQVGEQKARAALRAIDDFEQAEARRWEQVRAGTLPPIELTPEEQLDDLMQEGYELLEFGETAAACERWLGAWQLVKQMATPEMRTTLAFDEVYHDMLQSVYNWSRDLEMELGNAGYHERRIQYVHGFLEQFPDEGDDAYVSFKRAEGEALWNLGRQAEAEAVYRSLVGKLPDKAWAYIGWADEYFLYPRRAKDFEKGEAILLQALNRPDLDCREDVLDRMVTLYGDWGKKEEQATAATQVKALRAQSAPPLGLQPSPVLPSANAPVTGKKPRPKRKKRRKRRKRK